MRGGLTRRPPHAPALSPDLPDSPSLSSKLPSPSSWPGGDPCPHERRALGPGDRLTSLHLGPQAHTQPWKREPCERSALSSEQCLSSLGASWALVSPDGAGWLGGGPSRPGLPLPLLISPRQSRAGRVGAMASPPCGPGCEDGGDLGVLQTETTGCVLSGAGASCHAIVTSASPQEGEQPLLESLVSSP